MVFRTAGAVATLLIGLAGPDGQALAQYAPLPPQAYPAPQGYPPYRQLPPVDIDDDGSPYDRPLYDRPVYGRPLPPGTVVPPESLDPPPAPRYGRLRPVPPADIEPLGPAPGFEPRGYDPRSSERYDPRGQDPRGYDPRGQDPRGYDPRGQDPRGYDPRGQDPRGYDPAAASRPYPGVQSAPLVPPAAAAAPAPGAPPGAVAAPGAAEPQDGFRPPLPIGPDPNATGAVRGDPRSQMAALPPEVRPEYGPRKELPPQFRRTLVDYRTKEPVGTIIIDTQNTHLYLVLGNGKAMRYGVGVGREGFTWSGAEKVTKMAEWPDWNPPSEMIERQPYLPRFMAGGEGNPLGARALYLGKTVYRIHGTNQPSTIGTFVSSGCIRLTNEDITDLYTRVKVGTRVVVLPGAPPATAAAMPITPGAHGAPPVSMSPAGPPPGAVPLETTRRPPPPFVR
jgi:lipoprotein-anchoring transpeptidase ErfK/SrfK